MFVITLSNGVILIYDTANVTHHLLCTNFFSKKMKESADYATDLVLGDGQSRNARRVGGYIVLVVDEINSVLADLKVI